jgi:glycosyltransferase involved in cell wall biosynthesis
LRVLVLHSRYLSGDVSGENRVVADEVEVLRSAGHEVALHAPAPVTEGSSDLVRTATSAVWSSGAARTIQHVVRSEGIELVHAHNLFPTLSPAVLRSAKRAGAAVVMTLHNYRLLCLPATLMRNDRACEDCLGKIPWRGVVHACYRGSRAGSAVLAGAVTLHRAVGSFDLVDRFAAVSDVVRETHVRGGVAGERIIVKPNFAPAVPARQGPGSWFLFLGRLAPEKGVDTLLEAWRRLPPGSPELRVVGDGPEAEALRSQAAEGVRFTGEVPASETSALIAGARAVLVPSRWEEPAVPRVLLEAFAAGVPVVASDRGALPGGVDDGGSGFVVPAEDADAWADRATRLIQDDVSLALGAGALKVWRDRYSPASGLRALESLYAEALEVSRAARS